MSNPIFHAPELLQSREQKEVQTSEGPQHQWMASGVLDVSLEYLTAYYENEVQ